jgi:hypothetical protein
MFKNLFWNQNYSAGDLIGERCTGIFVAVEEGSILVLLVTALVVCCFPSIAGSAGVEYPYSIELEQFRWTTFPLRVLVDMNQWSVPDYAVAVREALDDWMKSIWNYTHSFDNASLPAISYVFYMSTINETSDYDVLVTFTANRIPPGSNTVGVTTYEWQPYTHEPIPPIMINVTTFSATASNLFVKDVVMHEFGHVLGLGHAASSSTLDGPELMYNTSSKNEAVYPSTLDVYGFTALYRRTFSQSVQLPSDVPYVMLAEGVVPSPTSSMWEDYREYVLVVVLFLLIVAAVVLGRIRKEKKPEEPTQQLPPPPLS